MQGSQFESREVGTLELIIIVSCCLNHCLGMMGLLQCPWYQNRRCGPYPGNTEPVACPAGRQWGALERTCNFEPTWAIHVLLLLSDRLMIAATCLLTAKLLLFARLFQSLARPMELHCVLGGRRLFGGSVPVFMTNFIWTMWTHFVPVNKEFQYVSGHASEFWSSVCLRTSETIIDHHRWFMIILCPCIHTLIRYPYVYPYVILCWNMTLGTEFKQFLNVPEALTVACASHCLAHVATSAVLTSVVQQLGLENGSVSGQKH